MEIFKFILTNYGPAVAACFLMIYLCFFIKKQLNGNEQKLKDSLASVLRENAELKVQLKEQTAKLNKKVEELNIIVGELMEEAEKDVRDNEEAKN